MNDTHYKQAEMWLHYDMTLSSAEGGGTCTHNAQTSAVQSSTPLQNASG